ncbi:MAG: L-threonylcarbamoyladenylate synthase [Rikenellaceae bacterium]
MGRLIKLYETNTSERDLRTIADALEAGAMIIYPTDTLYALGCSLNSIKTIAKLKELKNKKNDNLSLIFSDISQLSEYARVDNSQYKIIKRNTPGAVTFILNATREVPNKFLEKKSTVGIRIPDNNITTQIVSSLGVPLVSTSIDFKNLDVEDSINPELIWEEYKDKVDLMVDGGMAQLIPSTVVDMSSGDVEIVREGDYVLVLD